LTTLALLRGSVLLGADLLLPFDRHEIEFVASGDRIDGASAQQAECQHGAEQAEHGLSPVADAAF
jgi:hypothetical protein